MQKEWRNLVGTRKYGADVYIVGINGERFKRLCPTSIEPMDNVRPQPAMQIWFCVSFYKDPI